MYHMAADGVPACKWRTGLNSNNITSRPSFLSIRCISTTSYNHISPLPCTWCPASLLRESILIILKSHNSQMDFLRTRRQQKSFLYSRHAKKRIWGTTGQQTSPQCLGRLQSKQSWQISKQTEDKNVIGSSQWVYEGKIMPEHPHVLLQLDDGLGRQRGKQWMLFISNSSRLLSVSSIAPQTCWWDKGYVSGK